MSSGMDPKYIYAQEHKLYYFFWITLHGIEKIETEKKSDANGFCCKMCHNARHSDNNRGLEELHGYSMRKHFSINAFLNSYLLLFHNPF